MATGSAQGNTFFYLSGSDKCGELNGYLRPFSLVARAYSSATAFSPPSNYSGPAFFGGGSVTSTNPDANEGFHDLSMAKGGGLVGDSIR